MPNSQLRDYYLLCQQGVQLHHVPVRLSNQSNGVMLTRRGWDN